jgi:hypothetical protein
MEIRSFHRVSDNLHLENSIHVCTEVYSFHILHFTYHYLPSQTLVESTFEFVAHFVQFRADVSRRHYLHTIYSGDAGHRIHEVHCTRITYP